MIINIRGTSGSGKSTVVTSLMDQASQKLRVMQKGRKQPLGYIVTVPGATGRIAIPGHYETACGGCDTLPSYDFIYQKVEGGILCEGHVVFEGLLVSEETKRMIELHKAWKEGRLPSRAEPRVIFVNTPVEVCLESIRTRRAARGDERPLKEDNTRNRIATIVRACQKLGEAGIQVVETDRAGAASLVADWVRL